MSFVMPHAIRILAPAKINLFLKVHARRPDGYHEISSLMAPISLYDRIKVSKREKGIKILCRRNPSLNGRKNLCYKASKLFFQAARIDDFGVVVEIQKNIPVAAGLGGGSSDAGAVLRAMNQLFGKPLKQEELISISESIGSDVPFFISCKPAFARGRGEKLMPAKLKRLFVVLATPNFGLKTADVYRMYDEIEGIGQSGLTKRPKSIKNFYLKKLVFENDLEKAVSAKFPEVARAKHILKETGAAHVLMSGSGPTVFGVFLTQKAAEEGIRKIPAEKNFGYFLAHTVSGKFTR